MRTSITNKITTVSKKKRINSSAFMLNIKNLHKNAFITQFTQFTQLYTV